MSNSCGGTLHNFQMCEKFPTLSLVVHAVMRCEARGAQAAGLVGLNHGFLLFRGVAQATTPVGLIMDLFIGVIDRQTMTPMISASQILHAALQTTLTILGSIVNQKRRWKNWGFAKFGNSMKLRT